MLIAKILFGLLALALIVGVLCAFRLISVNQSPRTLKILARAYFHATLVGMLLHIFNPLSGDFGTVTIVFTGCSLVLSTFFALKHTVLEYRANNKKNGS